MSEESRRTFSLTIHPWCMSPSRDEAVRAAEDNRKGPLPTLEEAIAAVTERRPPEPRGSGNVTGLRVAYDQAVVDRLTAERDAAIRERDKLRAERITQALTADRFASAVAEADGLRARVAEMASAAKLAPAANADGGSNHAAPAASGAAGTGWLTRDERLAVSGSILILDQHGPTNIGRTLMDLLARSLPPGPEAK